MLLNELKVQELGARGAKPPVAASPTPAPLVDTAPASSAADAPAATIVEGVGAEEKSGKKNKN
jgi:hypothetical protein